MKRFSILLVDDEERILNFLKTKLKLLNYEVYLANNGIDAIEQYRDRNLTCGNGCDHAEMDGFQTLKELRAFSSVPVIMLSARVMIRQDQRAGVRRR